jgi:hypothetical protein
LFNFDTNAFAMIWTRFDFRSTLSEA